jgi:hypothetical protein
MTTPVTPVVNELNPNMPCLQPIICECGAQVKLKNLPQHKKTYKHLDMLAAKTGPTVGIVKQMKELGPKKKAGRKPKDYVPLSESEGSEFEDESSHGKDGEDEDDFEGFVEDALDALNGKMDDLADMIDGMAKLVESLRK